MQRGVNYTFSENWTYLLKASDYVDRAVEVVRAAANAPAPEIDAFEPRYLAVKLNARSKVARGHFTVTAASPGDEFTVMETFFELLVLTAMRHGLCAKVRIYF